MPESGRYSLARNTRTETDQARRNWFPEFGFILQYRNHVEPSETDITEGEALSNNTASQLGPLKKPHLGYKRSFYVYLLYDRFLPPLLSSIL